MQLIQECKHYPPIDRIFTLVSGEKDSVFLDSSLKNQLGRYSIIALKPYLRLVKDKQFTINGNVSEESFETFLKKYLREHREENRTALPLVSGAIGYFSYDYGREKAGVKSRHSKEVDIPESIVIFYDDFIIEDHKQHKLFLIANDHDQDCEDGMAQLLSLVRRAAKPGNDAHKTASSTAEKIDPSTAMPPAAAMEQITESIQTGQTIRANFTKKDYMNAIDQMIRYIIEGDIYIANMTQQLQITSAVSPYDMFQKLRMTNPSPFGGYFNYGTFQIVSASPERFLQMRDQKVQTRPIKGTRKRGSTPKEDALLRRALTLSEKDRSELLMIVDLERNDLNQVCIPGSVEVTELFAVEAYATVFHLISNVVGKLKPDLTVIDLLEAAFPGGSITGAPKLRAMELIDELEHSRRNLYTGSMGYLSLDGDCDLNIVIRTAVYQNGIYHLGVGGGITYESDLEFEYEETLQKAQALLNALDCL